MNIEIFVDEVGEAGGVCVEEAATAASPGSAFTRMMAGMLGVGVGICDGVGFGVGVGVKVGATTVVPDIPYAGGGGGGVLYLGGVWCGVSRIRLPATAASITWLTAVGSAGADPVAEGGGDGGVWVRCSASDRGSGSSCGGGSSGCSDSGSRMTHPDLASGERCCW